MKVIVGLGNIGRDYQNTRHNIGFMFVDAVAKSLNAEFKKEPKLKCEMATLNISNQKVLLVKPTTYMNLSGDAVINVLNFYKLDLDDLLVIYDDLDLPVAKVRIRANGTSGGQKGMQSIINVLNTSEIKRIRIGIDKGYNSISHVLGKFNEGELVLIKEILNNSAEMIKDYLSVSFDTFMNRYNKNARS